MSYKITYSAEAAIQLDRLESIIARRIIKKIESTQNNPYLFFKRLTGHTEYKLRIGDYRVIAEISDTKNLILIRTLGHRKNIYAKL